MINFYNMHKDEMENKKIWLVKVDDHGCDEFDELFEGA